MIVDFPIFLIFDICGVSTASVTVYQGRIHCIIGVVKADVPGTDTVFGLFIEIDTYVEAVTGGKPVVIAMFNVIFLPDKIFSGTDYSRYLFGNGSCSTGSKYP